MVTVIANLKGGSGKSTVAFNLAVWLGVRDIEMTVYDLDPQRTLSDVARVRQEEDYAPIIKVHAVQHPELPDHQGECLIDVGAANPEGMREAMRMADRIVIPVPPGQPDVWATQRFLRMVDEARHGLDQPMELLAFVNRADTHHAVRESDETEMALQQMPNVTVIPQRLYQRTIYRRSMSEGLAVFEMWRGSKAADEFEALAGVLYPSLAGIGES